MSNSWAGMVAKSITSKKRPKIFWNIFFSIGIFIVMIGMCLCFYQVVCERFSYDSEQLFVEYKNGCLTTDTDSFKIPKNDNQEIKIKKLLQYQYVEAGEKITLTISKISGDLLKVEHLDEVVYEVESTPITPIIIACIFLVFPILGFCIFMLVVVNIKSPGKRIAKFQNQFLLRFYK